MAALLSYPEKSSLSDAELQALLEQVKAEKKKKKKKKETHVFLKKVDLGHLFALRDSSTSWEQLSLGEQQRLAIARLLLQKPQFAILGEFSFVFSFFVLLFFLADECTSACSVAMEEFLYTQLKQRQIAFITICHRPALKAYHDRNLHLTGDGTYLLSDLAHAQPSEQAASRRPARDEHSLRPGLLGSKPEQFAALRSEPYQKQQQQQQVETPMCCVFCVVSKHTGKTRRRSLARQLVALMGVVLPSSSFTLALYSAAVGARAAAHFAFGVLSGQLLAAALARDKRRFFSTLAAHVVLDVTAGLLDEGAGFLQSRLAVQWVRAKEREKNFQISLFYVFV